MTLYSRDIQHLINSQKWPKRLQWVVKEYEYHLQFILFRDNFNRFDGEDRLHIAMLVKEITERVRASGIPIYMQVKESYQSMIEEDEQ